jgi:hypothetical protein
VIVLFALIALAALGALVYVVRSLNPKPAPVAPEPDAPYEPPTAGTVTVVLGNAAVAQVIDAPDEHGMIAPRRIARPDLGARLTTFGPFPGDWTQHEMVKALVHGWAYHSDAAPAWLDSNDHAFAAALATELKCPVGRPADWQEG